MATIPTTTPARRVRDVDYVTARTTLLVVGLAALLVTTAVAYLRRVDPVEVVATLLFVPVFIALLFWKVRGGLVAGIGAAAAYVLLRAPAISAVGFDALAGSIVGRVVALPLFGVLGGWATAQMEVALTKLELYDQIDDATGLYNARFFVEDTGVEVSRSDRYRTIFSVGVVEIPAATLAGRGRRGVERTLRELGSLIRRSVRKVDRPVHARAAGRHLLAIVLPETGAEGAEIFTRRLAARLSEHLATRGVTVSVDELAARWTSYPGDDGGMARLQEEFRTLDRLEHPPAPGDPS